MINWDDLVESKISAIHFEPIERKVQIEVLCTWGEKKHASIIASEVIEFVINEVRLSNILDRVNIFDETNAQEKEMEILQNLFFLIRGAEPTALDLKWPVLTDKFAQICNGDSTLLELEPAYGARAFIFAKRFTLEEK